MSVTITDFTTYAEIRSTVGMSIDELPDASLALGIYANTLELALDSLTISQTDLNPIKTVFSTLDPDTDSTAYNLTRLFATYTCALEVAISISMKAPKTLSDSKVTIGRFSPEATWQDTIKAITERLGKLRTDIEAIGSTSTATQPNLMTAVAPSYNPVTG